MTRPHAVALDALGNPMRREIISQLSQAPCTVHRLADQFTISRPAVSKHLRILEDAGLIAHEPAGTSNIYRLEPQGFAQAHGWITAFWNEALGRFKLVAENTSADAHDV